MVREAPLARGSFPWDFREENDLLQGPTHPHHEEPPREEGVSKDEGGRGAAARYLIFFRASFAPSPSALIFAIAMSRRIGAIPQLVPGTILSLATYFAASAITVA